MVLLQKEECACAQLPLRDLSTQPMVRGIDGGFLIQDEDIDADGTLECVANGAGEPSQGLLHFGTMVTKHLKSNAIALVSESEKGFKLEGAGMGNPNRLVSTVQAIEKATENGVTDFSDLLLISMHSSHSGQCRFGSSARNSKDRSARWKYSR